MKTPELFLDNLAATNDTVQNQISKMVQKRIPKTAGAGNGQGRKPKWNSPTMAIRIPAKYADRLLSIARSLDDDEDGKMDIMEKHSLLLQVKELRDRMTQTESDLMYYQNLIFNLTKRIVILEEQAKAKCE